MHMIERPFQRKIVEKYLSRGMTLEQIHEISQGIKRGYQVKKMIYERDYPKSEAARRTIDFYDDKKNCRNYHRSWEVFQDIRAKEGRNRLEKYGIEKNREREGKGYVLWSKG